jgi:hypothetical protein
MIILSINLVLFGLKCLYDNWKDISWKSIKEGLEDMWAVSIPISILIIMFYSAIHFA